ncbi:methenyltetrahydrofolate synthetase [Dermatophagoides pteronyssinus]|uniref:5-formyltetrahydrofolate cyclo-ligase n=1 Tax=Dermatophagoides pteronyssinus TaxID=6956 RepID=A0A6P6Y4Y1_DERPT|nr:5-formyltetrahydrofolate cyclo-ligase-like [Dermatophagoides pteronyssinus]
MMATTIQQSKRLLRKEIATRIGQLSVDEIHRQSQIIHEILFEMIEFKQSKRIGLYLSMEDKEIDTLPILKQCLQSNKQCFVPRYSPDNPNMQMLKINNWHDYEQMPIEPKYRIKQPDLIDSTATTKTTRSDAMQTGGLDLILVPGVAFTNDGLRLGHGKGYYDRWLDQCRQRQQMANENHHHQYPLTIGLAFDQQIVDQIPVTEFDIRIDRILYPSIQQQK